MKSLKLFSIITFLYSVAPLISCVKKKETAQVATHNNLAALRTAQEGFLKSENKKFGLYYTKVQYCDAEESVAEFHLKNKDAPHFFNELWGYICINKALSKSFLFDAQRALIASIEVNTTQGASKADLDSDIYEILDKQDSAVSMRSILVRITRYRGSWWYPKLTEYGSVDIHNIQGTTDQLNADGQDTVEPGLTYVKNFLSVPSVDSWRILRKKETTPGAPGASELMDSASADGGVVEGEPAKRNSDLRLVASVWNRPLVFGWHIQDFSAEIKANFNRKILLMLPMYQEMKKRRFERFLDSKKPTPAPVKATFVPTKIPTKR